ncbi:hypothetical protein TYRP_014758 [Tyrophagus putrescentiae]|nr:hypothetical protein TYRP_014758 [Tyrophagus putrescentiae]
MSSTSNNEEEIQLRRRLHLFSLALKNTTGHEKEAQQQQQNLDRLLDQLEQALVGASAEAKRTDWYAKLRLEWDTQISEYRQDFNKEDEKALPKKGVEKGKPTALNKTVTAADQKETHSNQNQPRFIKSKLQPSAVKFNPHSSSPPPSLSSSQTTFPSNLPPSLIEGIGRLSVNGASTTYLGSTNYEPITQTNHPSHQQTPTTTEHVHHHFHHHIIHHPYQQQHPFGWPPPPPSTSLFYSPFLQLPFASSSSRPQQTVVVAPGPLRAQVLSLLSLYPPVAEATNLPDLNRLFSAVAFTARWIFDYLDDDHFQTAVFRGFFAKMPALLQEMFLNPPPGRTHSAPSSSSSSSSQVERYSYELKLVNLIAFLRHFLLGLLMRERAEMSRQAQDKKEQESSKSPTRLPTRYCAFCKLETSHNIVDCPFRRDALCHRCFLYGHTMHHCHKTPLLPMAWLNSGQIKFEEERINI